MKTYLSNPTVRWFAGAIVAVSTFWNFWQLSAGMSGLPYREWGEVVVFEERFLEIKFKLWKEGYRTGDLGYVTERSLRGQPADERDDTHWAQLRYVTIPFNLVPNLPNAPYVLGDFTGGDAVPETPPGLVKIYDHPDGLVLYRREPSP